MKIKVLSFWALFSAIVLGALYKEVAVSQSLSTIRPAPAPALPAAVSQEVTAVVETEPVPNRGDAADDPAIWIHPTDPSQSIVIGTDKKGGLAVYDLEGNQLQYLPDGEMNNVDLRYNFPLGGESVALVAAGNRSTNSIAIYRVDPATRGLVNIAARTIPVGISETYGSCMYHSPVTGKYYFFVNDKEGQVEQWELFANGNGQVDALPVRLFDVGTQVEGCVADDDLAHLYIGEEAIGIWKYSAEPGAGTTRTLVDATNGEGYLAADVEGLSLYYGPSGTGYLIASSQGSDEYVVYQRTGTNDYVLTFQIVEGDGIDQVTGTDGIDVTSSSLGPAFPCGAFVAQDGNNDGGNQNFKLVPWETVAEGIAKPITLTTLAPTNSTHRLYLPLLAHDAC